MRNNFYNYLTRIAKNKGKSYPKNTAQSYCSNIINLSNNSNEKFLYKSHEELLKIKNNDNIFKLYKDFVKHYEENFDFYYKVEKESKNERFLQSLIINNINTIFPKYHIEEEYFKLKNKEEIDILLKHKTKKIVKIIELKSSSIRKENACQIISYHNELKSENKYPNHIIEMCLIGMNINDNVKKFINEEFIKGKDIEMKNIEVKTISVNLIE